MIRFAINSADNSAGVAERGTRERSGLSVASESIPVEELGPLMTDESNATPERKAQPQRLLQRVASGEPLSTCRGSALGPIFFCDGCYCGRTDKGLPNLPQALIKSPWKQVSRHGSSPFVVR